MKIRPREVQAKGVDLAGRFCEYAAVCKERMPGDHAAKLLMLGAATMLAVLFIAVSPAWAQEATNTPEPEGTPDLPDETGEQKTEVPRGQYDEEPGERTVAEVTKTETPAYENSIPSSPKAKPGPEAPVEPVAEPSAEPKAEPLPKLPARQTPKGPTPILPKTGGADLLPLFLGASCLVVGVLALVLGRGGGRPGVRPVDRPPEGR